MKIAVACCALNEERNIARFIGGYSWADWVLIADGGSSDATIEVAHRYPVAQVRSYEPRVWLDESLDLWRNPIGGQRNFLLDWAIELGADWFILDDCDCVPNALLREDARELLQKCERDFIYAVRLYLWRDGEHFPKLAKPGRKGWEPSIWGWRPKSGLRCLDDDMDLRWNDRWPGEHPESYCRINPPHCLLHDAWPNDEVLNAKLARYRTKRHPAMLHPLEFGGLPELLPEWATE